MANPKRRHEFKQNAIANKTTQTSYKAAENFKKNIHNINAKQDDVNGAEKAKM